MATIAESILVLQRRFESGAIATPRLDAELLLGHALGLNRTELLAALRDPLPDEQRSAIERLAERRISGEPVAYIVGHKEFYGRDFLVGPAVLTPRPETELLVEWALAWLADHPDASIVDVGAGCGAIAITVALGAPRARSITAIDDSEAALAVARANADRLRPHRIQFQVGDLLSGYDGQADLVLANLPYLRPDQIEGKFDLVAEPRAALDGGRDGLEIIARLIPQLPDRLAPRGAVALEIDPSQSAAVSKMLADALPGSEIAAHKDLAGLDRFVTAVRI